jgi:hypothetical protein
LHRFAVQPDLGHIVFKNSYFRGIQDDLPVGNWMGTDWVASGAMSKRKWSDVWTHIFFGELSEGERTE